MKFQGKLRVMMKSKPFIIVATIIAAIIGAWVGMNMFNSNFALLIALAGFVGIGYLIYNGLRRNRSVQTVSDGERARILAEGPVAGARALVYREGFIGKLSGIDVSIDDVPYAQLKSPQSVAIDLAPGDHRMVAQVAGKNQPPLAFTVAPGETALIRIGMGIAGPEISHEVTTRTPTKLASIPMVRPDTVSAPVRPATSFA